MRTLLPMNALAAVTLILGAASCGDEADPGGGAASEGEGEGEGEGAEGEGEGGEGEGEGEGGEGEGEGEGGEGEGEGGEGEGEGGEGEGEGGEGEGEGGEGEGEGGVDGGPAAEWVRESADLLLDSFCDYAVRCSAVLGPATGPLQAGACHPGSGFRRSAEDAVREARERVERGELLFDPEAAATCLAAIRVGGGGEGGECDLSRLVALAPDAGGIEACQGVLTGGLEDGDECEEDSVCGSDTACFGEDECHTGTCGALHEDGGGCEVDAECADDLACVLQQCSGPGGAGEGCQTEDHCQEGLVCDRVQQSCVQAVAEGGDCGPEALCEAALQCLEAKCSQPPGEGDACVAAFGFSNCPAPLSCLEGVCVAPAAAGDDCGDGDASCDFGLTCNQGTCIEAVGPGDACVVRANCPYGFGCIEDLCQALPLLGDPCGAGQACMEGDCTAGLCALVPEGGACGVPEGATDLRFAVCDEGFCGQDGLCLPLRGAGGECTLDSQCEAGLACLGATLLGPGACGARCGG